MAKTDAELELEKQYKEYKAQFEQWKEKNKNSVGTDAYNQYVKQFEDWEKDVEKRRRIIREKAEREALEARIMAEEDEKERKAIEAAKEAEAAEAYMQTQKMYMAHHQKAMEAEKIQTLPPVHIQPQQVQYVQQQHVHVQIQQTTQPQQQTTASASGDINPDAVFREMMSVVMGTANAAMGGGAPPVTQQPPPSQQATGAPPQLWGNTKQPYDSKDPLFVRWGPRAAPAHVPPPPRISQVPTPCWMLLEQLREKKKMLAPHTSLPPPPVFAPNMPPPTMAGAPPTVS